MHSLRFAAVAAALAAAVVVFGCQARSAGDPAGGHRTPLRARAHRTQRAPLHPPAHVQTAEYLWTPTEAATDPRVYAPYLTWAYPLYGDARRVQSAGIKTIFYVNPVMPQRGGYEYDQLTGRFTAVRASDCAGDPVSTYGGKGLLADPRSPQASAFYSDVVRWYIGHKIHTGWDAFFIDNNGALYGARPLPCNYNPAAWGRAFDRAIAGVGVPIVTNSLAARADDVDTYVGRLRARNVIGGMFEECFNDRMWTAEENSQLHTIALFRRLHKPAGPAWWCYLDNTSAPGASAIPQRLFAYASFLLTYDPLYSLFQESFTTQPSTFKIFPETGFVPLDPTLVPHAVGQLQTADGAYVQLFSWCYYRGKSLGACEVAVNPTDDSASLPNPWRLHHRMVLRGGGVLDGGSVSFEDSPPASLAPRTAAILVR